MIGFPKRGSLRRPSAAHRLLYSRYLNYAGLLLSVLVLFGGWYLADRYAHYSAQKDFEFHATEHLALIQDRIREHNRPPLEAVAKVTAHRNDFFLEITDSRGAALYRSAGWGENPSEYVAERKTAVSGEEWNLRYMSSPSFDAAKQSFYPILFAIMGMAVQLVLLYIIVELLRSRTLVKTKAAELENSLAWLDTILTSSVDGLHILDQEGKIIACSPSFLNLIGYSEEESKELSVYDWETKFPAEAIPAIMDSLSEMPMTFESIFRRKDGNLIDVDTSARVIVEGETRYIYASSRDISERKRAEKALRLEKETAQNYLDIVDVMIVFLDPGLNIRLLNRKGCEITGYCAEEAIGKNWIELCIPARLQAELHNVADMLAHSEGSSYHENLILIKNGEERLIAWRNQIIVDDDGLFVGILSSGEDITDIRLAQRKLKESESFYKSMFSSLNEAIITLDDETIVDCNAIAAEIFETPKDELLGRPLGDALPDPECRERSFSECLGSVYAHGTAHAECSFRFGGGRTKIVDLTFSRFGGAGEHKLIVIARDVTEKSEEERLLRMYTRQAQMGEMISMIAHQWRQPLAIINAITSQMRLRAIVNGEYEPQIIDNLVKIEEQSSHLSQTISDYRDFFRPDKPREYFSVSSLLQNALSLIDHTLKNHSIRIETWITCDPILYTYRNEVLQVMMALLKNALDAFMETKRKEGCLITLRVEQDEQYAILTIRDNAGGIPPEAMKKLFTPYFTTKQKNYGTGLGLHMSKTIIQGHCDGSIVLKSRGEETIVTVKLPYQKEES